MKSIIFLISGILLLVSCRKKDDGLGTGDTLAEGWVVDATTSKPVANATVQLLAHTSDLDWGGYGKIAEYTTDENGKFAFRFQSDDDHSYILDAYKPYLYFGMYNEIGIDNKKKNKNLILKIPPAAYIELHAIEVDSIPGHYLSFSGSLCSNGSDLSGIHSDKRTICKVDGNKDIDILWTTRPDENPKTGGGTYHLPPFDTTLIEIYF